MNMTLWSALRDNAPWYVPQWWGYYTIDNTIAEVEASAYFNTLPDLLIDFTRIRVGDIIYAVCSDGNVQLQVTAISPNVTTTVAPVLAGSVVTASIVDGNVTLAKLASGITPSHVVKYGAQYTTTGGAAAEAITINGVLATDIASCVIKDNGTANVTLLQTACTNNTLTLTFSGNPGNDCIVYYQIFRAAS